MDLAQLEPRFVRAEGDGWRSGVPRAEAQGVMFLCPKCYAENGGPAGTHQILCWSESAGAPASAQPGPGRWRMLGEGLGDLTLAAEPGRSASVLLSGGCAAHFHLAGGRVEFCK